MSRQTLVFIASIIYVALQIILVICSSSYSTVVLGLLLLRWFIQQFLTLSSLISKYKLSCLALPNFFVATREFVSPNFVLVASMSCLIILLQRTSLSGRILLLWQICLAKLFCCNGLVCLPNFVAVCLALPNLPVATRRLVSRILLL